MELRLEKLGQIKETLEGEHLKSAAELALHGLAKLPLNETAFRLVRGGERVEDSRLKCRLGSLELDNPVTVGAGWDKKGWAVDGLHALGFAAVEVGSVLVHPQYGNSRPRIWYRQGVGRNCLGFNSPGQEKVYANLENSRRSGVIGVSLGKNKLTPDSQAPWAHAAVAERLHSLADYFVINVASPNTPGLRNLLNSGPLTEIVRAVKAVLAEKGDKPLFIKTTVDLTLEDLDKVLAVCLDEGVTGIIDSNTTIDEEIKAAHGWSGQPGGVSGADPRYRKKCTERMRYITANTRGRNLVRIGAGAINDTHSAIERMEAGAQVIQVVTAIREHKGRLARNINLGLLEKIEKDGLSNIQELVGAAT